MPEVYLFHFDRPYWSNASHYVGYTKKTAAERITVHQQGKGSLLVKYALDHGCNFEVAMTESFETCQQARQCEIQIKNNGPCRSCPICKSKKKTPT